MVKIALLFPVAAAAALFGNGVNLQPSYYDDANLDFEWDMMKGYSNIKTVRIEIKPGHEDKAVGWIKDARGHGFEVVATYHDESILGGGTAQDVMKAGQWWADNYEKFAQAGDFTINLINEWGDKDKSASDYADAVNPAIAKIRDSTSYSGPIVLDAPGYGQVSSTLKDVNDHFLQDPNVILSLHIYPKAWNKNRYFVKEDVDDIAGRGAGCVLGEFGGYDAEVAVADVVGYAKYKGCAVLGWAWNGEGLQSDYCNENPSADGCDPSDGYDPNQGDWNMLQPSWRKDRSATEHQKTPYFDTIYSLLGNVADEDDEDADDEEPTMAPETTMPPAPPATTVAPDPSLTLKQCRPCFTMCAPCQVCAEGANETSAYGSCDKCWQCWNFGKDEVKDDEKHMDKDCDVMHHSHDWDSRKVRCLTDFPKSSKVTHDCRPCWATFPDGPFGPAVMEDMMGDMLVV